MFSLCIQANSLLSLSKCDCGISLGNFMYSKMCIVILGSSWSLWLRKCLATVLLFEHLMSSIWPLNLSITLFFFTYIFDMAPIAFKTINKVITLTHAISECIVGLLFSKFLICPDWEILPQYSSMCLITSLLVWGVGLGNFCLDQQIL